VDVRPDPRLRLDQRRLPLLTPPPIIAGLAEIAPRYDALLCDVWGVVHNGREPFADATAAMARFRAERGPVVLVSNSPRPGRDVAFQLQALGVRRDAWDAIVTSGDATRVELMARAPGPAWAIGPMRDAPVYEGTGVVFAEVPEEAAFVACTGLFDDEIETPEDFRARLRICADRALVMVCANPDRVVQRGDKTIYCAGALADVYLEQGGEVVMAGKPFPPIYELAYAEVDRLAGRPVARDRLLAVGDGLPTDVVGANGQGVDVLFTAASGIHAVDVLDPTGRLSAVRTQTLLDGAGAHASALMAALAW
jgi:HAD superfamily hydrolase (TIGR01459 family)